MQIRNNYDKDVFNGGLGRISALNKNGPGLAVSYNDRIILYEAADLGEIMTA